MPTDLSRLSSQTSGRLYKAAFMNKINEALGEAWQHIGAMLNKMIQRADSFCQTNIK
ncbi:MAG: hypothetical protein ACE5HS_12860 [bacterium]